MSKVYRYKVIRENLVSGNPVGKETECYSSHPLKIGGLYMHLRNLKGAFRVLEELPVEDD